MPIALLTLCIASGLTVTSQLSTSDLIALAVGVVQLVATVALAIWTVRRTNPVVAKPDDPASSKQPSRSLFWLWTKSSWLFVVAFALACYGVWSLTTGLEELSKLFVIKIVVISVYGTLNAVAAFGFFFIEFQMGLTLKLAEIVQSILHTQRQHGQIQAESLRAQIDSLAGLKSTKRRRSK